MSNLGFAPVNRTPAILGGTPAFVEPLHVGRPNLGSPEGVLERIRGVLDRKWLTNNGPLVREFEHRIAHRLSVRHCIATCNGTMALELAIRGLDLEGEVIVPSFTFVATAHALQSRQITPVFCDIDPQSHTIDARRAEELVTSRTSAILGVHLWGNACDVHTLQEIARRHDLALLFDASHAFDCTCGGVPIGCFGRAEVFSFHATKFVHAGEGGAITTNDDDLADRIRLMRNFGFAGYDRVVSIGVNGKMSEFCAAMGLDSLDHLAEFSEANRRVHQLYCELLHGLPGISVCRVDRSERHSLQYVVIDVDSVACPLTRDELLTALHAENILARRYFFPGCHRMEPYHTTQTGIGVRLPETELACRRVLQLPTGMNVSPAEVDRVVCCLRLALNHATEIRQTLALRSEVVENSAGVRIPDSLAS